MNLSHLLRSKISGYYDNESFIIKRSCQILLGKTLLEPKDMKHVPSCYIKNNRNYWVKIEKIDKVYNAIGSLFRELINKGLVSPLNFEEEYGIYRMISKYHNTFGFDYEKIWLDCKEDLIGFDNGVFDLSQGRFRKIEEEDFLSMSTGYDYSDHRDSKKEEELMNYFRELFGDQVDYGLGLLSRCLSGNSENKLVVVVRDKRDYSDTLFKLMKIILGYDLYSSGFDSYVMGATELKGDLRLKKPVRRMVCVEGPWNLDRLRDDLATVLERGLESDRYYRPLYTRGGRVMNQENLFVIVRDDFEIEETNKIKELHIKPIEDDLSEKLEEYRLSGFQILLDYYLKSKEKDNFVLGVELG